jgi:hypothetical protein
MEIYKPLSMIGGVSTEFNYEFENKHSWLKRMTEQQ